MAMNEAQRILDHGSSHATIECAQCQRAHECGVRPVLLRRSACTALSVSNLSSSSMSGENLAAGAAPVEGFGSLMVKLTVEKAGQHLG